MKEVPPRDPTVQPDPPAEGSGAREPANEPSAEEGNEQDRLSLSLRRIHARLSDKSELLKLHLKHYHLSLENFKRRTSQLQLPQEIYRKYAEVVRGCEACTRHATAPERSRVTGMRATDPGDLAFVDHVDLSIDRKVYVVLVVVDAASNKIWAGPQENKSHNETRAVMQQCFDEWSLTPKALCGDGYFMEPDFKEWYAFKGIKTIEFGPHTPWPNRAEAAVKLFKHYSEILITSIREMAETEPCLRQVTVREIMAKAVWARNLAVTYGLVVII